MTECGFTYSHYIDTVKKFPNSFIRHDVDMSLDKAYQMAKIEHDNGIKSTYFILPTNPLYNIFDQNNQNILKDIIRKGHNIGVHYDLSLSSNLIIQQMVDIVMYAAVLSRITQTKINFSAVHNPVMGKSSTPELIKLLKKYDLIDMGTFKDKYISDSGHNWREGCFCNHIGKYDFVQINIHPEWWNHTNHDWHWCYSNIKNIEENKISTLINVGVDNICNYHDRLGLRNSGK